MVNNSSTQHFSIRHETIYPSDDTLWDAIPLFEVPLALSEAAEALTDSTNARFEAADVMVIPPNSVVGRIDGVPELGVAAVKVPRKDGKTEVKVVTEVTRREGAVKRDAVPHFINNLL